MKHSHLLLLTLLAGLMASPLAAQVTTAGIHGIVSDRTAVECPMPT